VTDEPLQPAIEPAAAELGFAAIGRLDATEVAASYSAVGGAQGERVSVEIGALGGAIADRISVSQSAVGLLVAGEAEIEQALLRTVVARRVSFRRASGALVLIAGRVEGDVRTVLDWRGALAAGVAAGVVLALLRPRR